MGCVPKRSRLLLRSSSHALASPLHVALQTLVVAAPRLHVIGGDALDDGRVPVRGRMCWTWVPAAAVLCVRPVRFCACVRGMLATACGVEGSRARGEERKDGEEGRNARGVGAPDTVDRVQECMPRHYRSAKRRRRWSRPSSRSPSLPDFTKRRRTHTLPYHQEGGS
jgi:hypothetical protein